jgi:hypothetical protein
VRTATCQPRDLPTGILRASQHRAGCTDAANVPFLKGSGMLEAPRETERVTL